MDKQQSESDVAFLRQQKSNHRFDTEGARACDERNPAAGAIFFIKMIGSALRREHFYFLTMTSILRRSGIAQR